MAPTAGPVADRASLRDAALDAIISIDAAGHVVEFNPSAERMFGVAHDDAVGRELAEVVVPPQLRAAHRAGMARVAAGAPLQLVGKRVELTAQRADGACFPVELTITRSSREPLVFTAFLRDLTEQHAAAEALRRSEERFASAFAQAPVGIALVSIDERSPSRILQVNDAFCRMTGLDEDTLVARHLQDLVHADDRMPNGTLFAPVLRGERVRFEVEKRLVRSDGSVLWGLLHGTVLRGDDGEPFAGVVQILDVTERREAERRAAELLRENTMVLESAADGILRIDATGRIRYANSAAGRLLGFEPAELAGVDVRDVAPPDGTGAFRRRDGMTMFVEASTAPLTDDGSAGTVMVFSDVTRRREMEARLRRLAEEDALTGLLNRRSLENALAARLDAGTGGSLLVLDLDHFKLVNDSFGHAAGDELLRAAAVVLRDETRGSDVIGRLGGDEFAVLVPSSDAGEARRVAERIVARIEAERPGGLTVGASVGVVCVQPGHRQTADDLLVAADVALYDAKNAGRGRVSFYSGKPGASLTWVQRIRAALAEDRLLLHAQPIVDLRTGEHVHDELLVRMLDGSGSVVPPSTFLPTAERFGLIRDVDRWVLRRGIEAAAAGRRVHVNLSGTSVGSAEVLEVLERGLHDTGAPPDHLVLELTETLAVADMAQARAFALRVRDLGCSLALDDFGTGFGSLSYLRHLPAEFLKIDMSFVRDLPSSEPDRAVVDAIVRVAERFGLRTIAEGVESEEARRLLAEAGVDLAQGFHLGRPAPL